VQGIDPGELGAGVVSGYQDLLLISTIVGTTSHRQTVAPTTSVGKVIAPTVAASASQRVWERLRDCPDGPLPILHRAPHAEYLAVVGRCVGGGGSAAVAVPCALRLASRDLGVITTGSAAIAGGVLQLDGTPLTIRRMVDVRVPPCRLAPLAPARRRAGTQVEDGLVAEIGLGPGLTPEADDVLCGWLAMHRAAGIATPRLDARVLDALGRTTLLSATLLECAVHGEVVPEFAAWVAALGTRLETRRAVGLARIGHTSGAALLRGARLALAHLYDDRTRAA
jgi:hypothetical protein